MGASGVGGGGRRNANSELNLVPFIDLLSTLICFLLITAVWQQIAMLSTQGAAGAANESTPPPDVKKVDLSVSLLLDHLLISEGGNSIKLLHRGPDPDYAGLTAKLAEWKSRYPDRSDLVLHTDSQALYKHLIKLMDTMTGAQFADVSVNTN